MSIPFTIDQFLDLFKEYNHAVWPMQILAYVLGLVALILVYKKSKSSGRIISAILAFFWLWTGFVYHIVYFTGINPLAWGVGGAFLLQGGLLLWEGTWQGELIFRFKRDMNSITGILFIVYAMIAYPLLGGWLGRTYPHMPSFGLTPCPVGIFTFGLFMLIEERLPQHLLFIPFLWSAIGFFAAVTLGIVEDIGLLIAGITGSLMIIYREQKITAQRLRKVAA